MTVYADVLIVVNYIVNLLLLLAAAKILGRIIRRWRICLAAFLGAVGSLVIFLPYIGLWFQTGYKLLLSFGMTLAAFGFAGWKSFFKSLFVVFTVSFIFAGLMLAFSFLFNPKAMVFFNGVVYFDISALMLIVTTTIAYLLLLLFERIFFSRTAERKLYSLTVSSNGKTVSLKGLADTGSSLKEPFSGAPVIVCDKEIASRIIPQEEERLRVIPCLTVTGEGTLKAFRPDEIFISGEGTEIRTSDVYIASSKEPIRGEYQALINPQVIDRA